MKNFINKLLWVCFIFLSPITLIGLLSQNSIPNDFLYPVKLGIEKVGLFAFSFTPEAKASYNSSLTERRFDEAQKMIVSNSNIAGLNTLVEQTTKTQESVQKVENPEQKKVLEKKLIENINKYQEKLTQTQQSVDPSYIPTSTPIPTSPPTPQEIVSTPIPHRYVPNPTPTPHRYIPKPSPTYTTSPTLHLYPSPSTQPPVVEDAPQTPAAIVNDIEITKQELEVIKNQIQQEQEIQMPNNEIISLPTNVSPSENADTDVSTTDSHETKTKGGETNSRTQNKTRGSKLKDLKNEH